MKKSEVKELLNEIKVYYSSQFFIDNDVLDVWEKELINYDYKDCEEQLKKHLKESPDYPPKPHIFTKDLLTPEEKEKRKQAIYTIQCNLCGKWMTIDEYNEHYDKCMDIDYLLRTAKKQDKEITREEIEKYDEKTFNNLMRKYEPKIKNKEIANILKIIGE